MEHVRSRRSARLATALAALVTALVAPTCGVPGGPDAAAGDSGGTTAGPPGSFPVVVSAANGEVTIDELPEAIVSLSPSLTEIAFAVGAGEQVIAVDSASDHPDGVPVTDLSGFRPNIEAIAGLEPDLVLVARDRDDVVATLDDVGISALLLESPGDLDGVYEQIATVGAATGHGETASELIGSMRDDIDELLASMPDRDDRDEPVAYFYELSGDYHSLTSDTFVGSLLDRAGLVNVADAVDDEAGTYPQLGAEFVLGADPDLVFVAHTDGSVPTIDELAGRPGWGELSAITDGNVVLLDPDVASRWGPRVVDLLAAVVEASALIGAE